MISLRKFELSLLCLTLVLKIIVISKCVTNKNLLVTACGITLLKQDVRRRKQRNYWMLRRSVNWWANTVKTFDDNDWMKHFRIRKATFDRLVMLLADDLKPDGHSVRTPMPLEKRIAVAMYKLATAAEHRVVASRFGIHKTSVHRCLHSFCHAICKKSEQFIKLPKNQEAQRMSNENHRKTGFPQVYGAIGACHIHITPPKEGLGDFLNSKGFPSLVLQGVVDHRYRFRDVSIKMAGSVEDATVLRSSSLYQNSSILPKGNITINNVEVPLIIVGGPAYPTLPWLMIPYTGSSLTPKQETFNSHHSNVHMFVENAFGRVKARWQILKGQLNVHIDEAPFVIGACCILHNLCEETQTPVPIDTEIERQVGSSSQSEPSVDSNIRDAIADYIFTTI